MLGPPINDRECLEQATAYVAEQGGREDLDQLAARFPSTAALVAWIQGLPQRADLGTAPGQPSVACDVPQRARLPASDPNCFERALLYLALAERVDPRPWRQLVTLDSQRGRHTFPVENAWPVVLDPAHSANALAAGAWRAGRANAGSTLPSYARPFGPSDVGALFEWLTKIAEEPATRVAGADGFALVTTARVALAQLVMGGQVPRGAVPAVAFTLHAAELAAPLWEEEGIATVRIARDVLTRVGVLAPTAPTR
jgi:hypothetical protein